MQQSQAIMAAIGEALAVPLQVALALSHSHAQVRRPAGIGGSLQSRLFSDRRACSCRRWAAAAHRPTAAPLHC